MTAPLDEKARDAALTAWFANTAQGWHAAMEAAIRAYLAASPSPSETEPVISDEMVESVAEALCRSSGTGWEFTQAKGHWREKARDALSAKPQSGSDKP